MVERGFTCRMVVGYGDVIPRAGNDFVAAGGSAAASHTITDIPGWSDLHIN